MLMVTLKELPLAYLIKGITSLISTHNHSEYMNNQELTIKTAGAAPESAKAALILLHGRGGTADNIIRLGQSLHLEELALFAPEAADQTWYPYRFTEPEERNEPYLTKSLSTIALTIKNLHNLGFENKYIFFMGFSQGACLAAEYVARNAQTYGGLIVFTGGLIGKELDLSKYGTGFQNMPVLLSTGNPDIHVPLSRVEETRDYFERAGASVTLNVYENRPHTITQTEILLASKTIKDHF